MSSQNTFPGQNGRPLARPTTQQPTNGQPSWVNPQAQPQTPVQTGRPQQQPAFSWPDQQPAQGYPGYSQPGAAGQQRPQSPSYSQWSESQPGQGGYGQEPAAGGQSDPYAPQFEPYVPPSRPNLRQPAPNYPRQQPAAPAYQQQRPAPQWSPPADQGGYGAGGYDAQQPYQAQPAAPAYGQPQYQENELSSADWAGPHDSFGNGAQQHYGDPQLGFAQAEGGELEPVYNEDDLDYEDEEDAPRSRRGLMILVALIGAIAIGGGVAYGYKKFSATTLADANPPVIKSDDSDAKTKPADAGGKQFPYSDSKIMGRLGDGTSTATADDPNAQPQSPPPDASAPAPDSPTTGSVDEGGARKVSTLVVGRDGTIMPPATPTQDRAPVPSSPSDGAVVPGTSLVDLGQPGGGGGQPPAGGDNASSQSASSDDTPPPRKSKPVKITTINGAGASDGSSDTPPPVKKKLKKVARADPAVESDATADAPPVTQSSSAGTGFVAVLASVPHSDSSRIDALKRFADMQQKYSDALSGKTPDIATANLSKGVYDRLVVGPPGSREQASAVCTQLKAEGYKGCWVTSY